MLHPHSAPYMKFVVSTAHFPWRGSKEDVRTGVDQRFVCAHATCEILQRICPPTMLCVFGGDLNDDFHPVRIIKSKLGYREAHEFLDIPPSPTHPVRPSAASEESNGDRTIDWIMAHLPSRFSTAMYSTRFIAVYTKAVRGGGGSASCTTPVYPPSDHRPVVAVLEMH